MIVVRNLQDTHQITDTAIRDLVQQRIHSLSDQGFSLDEVGHIVVTDSTDTVNTIEQHLGVAIGSYELIEVLPFCVDVVYVLDQQAGTGIEMFVPKDEDWS